MHRKLFTKPWKGSLPPPCRISLVVVARGDSKTDSQLLSTTRRGYDFSSPGINFTRELSSTIDSPLNFFFLYARVLEKKKNSRWVDGTYNRQSINHRGPRWTNKPTFGILVPARRGFGTPAGDPCCCHASFPPSWIDERERERERGCFVR